MVLPPFDAELVGRLIFAALFAAAIGVEREIHDHPAGMRTHLLVGLGSAVFTVISLTGFGGDGDRVAAQVVSGIGFLGGGAILKFGANVRGLTTAASLWTAASIGMAFGAGGYAVGVVGTIIIVLSLWPLSRVSDWLRGRGERTLAVRASVTDVEAVGGVVSALTKAGATVESLRIGDAEGDGARSVEIDVDVPSRLKPDRVIEIVVGVGGVESAETAGLGTSAQNRA